MWLPIVGSLEMVCQSHRFKMSTIWPGQQIVVGPRNGLRDRWSEVSRVPGEWADSVKAARQLHWPAATQESPSTPSTIPSAILSRRCALMRLSINRLLSDPCDLIRFSSAEVDGRKSLCSSPRREILVCATMAPLWTRHRDPGKGKWGEGSSLCGNLQSAPTSSLPPHVDLMGRCTEEGLEMGYIGFLQYIHFYIHIKTLTKNIFLTWSVFNGFVFISTLRTCATSLWATANLGHCKPGATANLDRLGTWANCELERVGSDVSCDVKETHHVP